MIKSNMPIVIDGTTVVHEEANTVEFYANINQALTGQGEAVRVRVKTPVKEIIFTASIDSAHALITHIASTWSGAELFVTVKPADYPKT